MFTISTASSKATAIRCEAFIDKQPITMEVDPGAVVSLMSEHMCKQYFHNVQLSKTNLVTYTQDTLPILGQLTVPV